MSDSYRDLLDATTHYLESLKASGTRFVSVERATLDALAVAAPARSAAPAAAPAVSRPPAPVSPRASAQPAPVPASQPAPVVPPAPAISGSPEKVAALAEIRDRAMQCMKCAHLAATRRNVVFGVGSVDADLMFVGEAPGADEDAAGEPFVGAAGQLLTKMIQTMGLSRETVYIANILKCRPDMPAGSSGNRKPSADEMKTCIPYLHSQIDLIRPKVIVALGATAIEGLLGISGISKLRGKWQTYRDTPLMPTYHPAYLLRNQALSEKRRVWEDLLAVMEKLGMPISDRQRGFFLPR